MVDSKRAAPALAWPGFRSLVPGGRSLSGQRTRLRQQTQRRGRSLATLWDLNADWQLSLRTTLSFYYARALGHRVVLGTYPEGKNANYAYVEVTQRF